MSALHPQSRHRVALESQRPTRCACINPIPMGRSSGQWCQRCRLPLPALNAVASSTDVYAPESGELVAHIYEIERAVDPVLVQPARIGGDEA